MMFPANTEPEQNKPSVPRYAWSINDFCVATGLSRSFLYEMIKDRKIKTICIGRRRLVPHSELLRLLELKEA